MADFRRWITALAVLALFAGLASAQVGIGGGTGGSQMVCNSVAQNVPTIRSEGVTELVGDILITCTGGPTLANGATIPPVNIIVNITGTNAVTSRLSTGNSAIAGASEALLMIDEPGAPGLTAVIPGFGPAAPQNVCATPQSGCTEVVTRTTDPTVPVAVDAAADTVPGRNVFQGMLTGTTQITFFGVPILPPGTNGVQRVIRITNIRVNGAGATSQSINANLASSAPASFPVAQSAVTVGFVQSSLTTSVTGVARAGSSDAVLTSSSVKAFTQCNAVTFGSVAFLNFTEKFGNAFKTKVVPTASTTSFMPTNAAGSFSQNVPGGVYNSESGFILAVNGGVQAGLADYGTRFQAVFANLPAGATVYVSRYNVTNFTTAAGSGAPGGLVGTTSIAAMTTGASSSYASPGSSSIINSGGYELVAVSGTAVWEVTSTNPSTPETFSFAVFISYTPDLSNNKPTPGSAASVTLSYSPIDTTPGTLPGTPNTIPRFVNPTPVAAPLLNITQCQTVLLFPYVTSQGGFDTGIAISNTSMDPLGPTATQTSTGTCTLNFYGAAAPTAGISVPSSTQPTVLTFGNGSATTPLTNPTTIPAGGQLIFSTSTVVPNFQGYMFATCNFQYAHGFAFVSDVGARNLAMGYLALVVNNGQVLNTRAASSASYAAESLNQ